MGYLPHRELAFACADAQHALITRLLRHSVCGHKTSVCSRCGCFVAPQETDAKTRERVGSRCAAMERNYQAHQLPRSPRRQRVPSRARNASFFMAPFVQPFSFPSSHAPTVSSKTTYGSTRQRARSWPTRPQHRRGGDQPPPLAPRTTPTTAPRAAATAATARILPQLQQRGRT